MRARRLLAVIGLVVGALPRQRAASFSIDQAVEKMRKNISGN